MSKLDEHAKAAIQLINENKLTEAIVHFQAALEIDNDRPDLNNALGMTFLRRGDAANGLPYLKRAVQLAEPYDTAEHKEMRIHFHIGLATAQQALDQVSDSLETLRDILTRWPDSTEGKVQLSQLLVQSGQLDEGLNLYQAMTDDSSLEQELREMTKAITGTISGFIDAGHSGRVFLEAHQESYKKYFDEVSAQQVAEGWYAEAARMRSGPDGESQPIIAEGARPYAMERVDLVNPKDGTAASVYSEQEPMYVALNGFEPLAQVPVCFPWPGEKFDVLVCSRSPWHWLDISIQFLQPGSDDELVSRVDPSIGEWYLQGFNGDFGEKDSGRFHYITDPEITAGRAVTYTVDLGRARFEAIASLMKRLQALHQTNPIDKVMFGQGKLVL